MVRPRCALLLLVVVAHACSAARLPEVQLLKPVREAIIGPSSAQALPVVLWHGMGDSCCSLGSMGSIKKLIEDKLGVFVHSIATGTGEYADVASSFYGNLNDQVSAFGSAAMLCGAEGYR
eukprot:GHUV01006232.1.p1 GENE.GHUV01006232.1~~GHUV01006232.1.p1  ORF type:complete len:120 (+),score=18.55 GHUV01006232.1:110-469(+)